MCHGKTAYQFTSIALAALAIQTGIPFTSQAAPPAHSQSFKDGTHPGNGKGNKHWSTNSAPTISGTPDDSVLQETPYGFKPTASDADGDPLTFHVSNLPSWATFDKASGAISGSPGAGDIGTYPKIVIEVSDGTATAQLPAFSIDVLAYALGSATLSWLPPTENVDGSPLLDLAGYRIYWGQDSGNYVQSVDVMNPGITTYIVENLPSGTYYFAAKAINSVGEVSAFSAEISAPIL